jgi:hypothetical protein
MMPAATGADVPPLPPAEPASGDALMRALEAQRRAEELQRDPAAMQRIAIEQHIDRMPGLTEHKRAFLKAHPQLIADKFLSEATARSYQAALNQGVPDDSEEMNAAILAGVQEKWESDVKVFEMAAASTPSRSEPQPTRAAPAPEITRLEEPAIRQMMDPSNAPPRSTPAEAGLPPMPATSRARGVPLSAPVSRNIPSPTGRPTGSITLTPEEREIARNSMR